MNSQGLFKNSISKCLASSLGSKGFSYLETIIVVAISLILAAESFSLGAVFLQRNNLKNTRDVLVSYLNSSGTFSMAGKNGHTWGVHISSNTITMFQGTSFSNRNPEFDVSYNIPGNVTVTLAEVTFNKYTGETNETEIHLLGSGGSSYRVNVNSMGIVTYE